MKMAVVLRFGLETVIDRILFYAIHYISLIFLYDIFVIS